MRALLALGAFLIAALGVGLFVLTRDDVDAATKITRAREAGSAPAEVAKLDEPAPQAPGPRTGKIDPKVIAPSPPPKTSDVRPDSTPSLEAPAAVTDAWVDPLPTDMRAVKTSLRRQVDAIDALVSDCVAKNPTKLTGYAHLTVEFAPGANGKVAVTSVGVDTEVPPTYQDDKLLKCLAETGRHMQPDIDSYVRVTAKHEVDLDNGSLVEHKLSAFDVWRPGDKEPLPH